ncbi:egl nine homolog 1-like [Gigantopelta aegis]|uniref:egl nine homolog 1-like n=1 Tax=Gigantopelta aegis TaxID=1735272 RepID=UPI001B88A624|nr:egl nine homolog 1-like [Gigantopelta aegis]
MADGKENCLRDTSNVCHLCGAFDGLSLCGGCRKTWYCCKQHQKDDWKEHKKRCSFKRNKKDSMPKSDDSGPTKTSDRVGDESRSTDSDECACSESSHVDTTHNSDDRPRLSTERLNKKSSTRKDSPELDEHLAGSAASALNLDQPYSEFSMSPMPAQVLTSDSWQSSSAYIKILQSRFKELSLYVVKCLTKYGVCVIDNFLGESKGMEILNEIKTLHSSGQFHKGQVAVNADRPGITHVRGDLITWVDGSEDGCSNIHFLISCMDAVMTKCQDQLEHFKIEERTKAMVACYPGKKTGYLRHIDNPNEDGRCVTCIYYLNKDWDVKKHGGLLRIFPEGEDMVANVEPKFDRLVFFWSDRRNPHEVMPTFRERYAVTVWYYDTDERNRAVKRFKRSLGNFDRKGSVPQAVPLINSKD